MYIWGRCTCLCTHGRVYISIYGCTCMYMYASRAMQLSPRADGRNSSGAHGTPRAPPRLYPHPPGAGLEPASLGSAALRWRRCSLGLLRALVKPPRRQGRAARCGLARCSMAAALAGLSVAGRRRGGQLP